MILKIKAKNIRLFDEIEIDFSIKSKKKGNNVKSNDFIEIYNKLKIQKKIGIIGTNASGKTSFLNVFMIFWRYFNIGQLKNQIQYEIFQNAINLNAKENFDKIKQNNFKKISQNIFNMNEFIAKNIDFLNKEIPNYFLSYYIDSCSNSDLEQIYFEIHHVFESKILIRKFYINKNGIIKFETYDENYVLKDKHEINFYDFKILINETLSIDGWMFDWIDIPFNGKFDFGLNNPQNFLTTSYNRNIITLIFDYLRHTGNQVHFKKWIRLADASIDDLIMDKKNKIFSIKKDNDENINLDSLSLGTKKWIIMYYFIYIFFKPSKLCTKILTFDEIENSFHEKLIETLLEVIDQQNDIQLVFSTHNPNVFSQTYRHDGIYLTSYDNKKYSINRLDEYKLRKDKVISSMYLKEEIGNHPNSQHIYDFFNINEKE